MVFELMIFVVTMIFVIMMMCVIVMFFVMMTVFVFDMMMMMLMGPKPYSSPRSLQPCQRLWTLFQQQVPVQELCILFWICAIVC